MTAPCVVCGREASSGAYCWRHGPESAAFSIRADPGRPPVTAADVLDSLLPFPGCRRGETVPGVVHGECVRFAVDGADVRVYRDNVVIWAGRLVAYPAALRVDRCEAGRPYPCPRCGQAVMASLAKDRPEADCPACGTRLALEFDGVALSGRWLDRNRWRAA